MGKLKDYDRLAITLPKGLKQAVEAHAKRKGGESTDW